MLIMEEAEEMGIILVQTGRHEIVKFLFTSYVHSSIVSAADIATVKMENLMNDKCVMHLIRPHLKIDRLLI